MRSYPCEVWVIPVVVLAPAILFVIGGLLLRGQAGVRGVRWWIGWPLFMGGGLAFVFVQWALVL
jgi:hypothetical protein